MTSDLSELDVFYGDLTVAQAHVYARLPRPVDDAGLSLVGQIRGPRCLQAETLPVTSPLIDLGPGPTLLARAAVPDPCFWSPDLPAIYDVTVELRRAGKTIATAKREIGLKALGVRGRSFALESKRWILRGVSASSTIATLPRQWREVHAGYVADGLDEDRLAEASQWGALTVVELNCTASELPQRLRELASYPAVAMVVVHGGWPAGEFKRSIVPNLLLAQAVEGDENVIQSWADVLWLQEADAIRSASLAGKTSLSIIAVRKLTQRGPLADARAACDALQRELAPVDQFAGYVV